MSPLPMVALGDVASIDRKVVPPDQIKDGTTYLGLEHLERGGRIAGSETIGDFAVASAKHEFSNQHILYGKLRPNLGKIARPSFAGVSSTDILPVLPGPRVDKAYLFHFLSQDYMIQHAASRAAGANLPRLSPKELNQFQIPLPPLDEQRRIAAILDQAATVRDLRLETISKLEHIKHAMTGNLLQRDWPSAPLGSVATTTSGGTPDRSNSEYYNGEIPWVKSGELHSGVVRATEETITEAGLKGSSAKLLPVGTVLIAMYGATAGVVSQLGIPATTNQAICAITPSLRLNAVYLIETLRHQTARLSSLRSGGAQPNLSQKVLRSLEIPIPPVEEQLNFAQQIEQINTNKGRVERSHHAIESLMGSLQTRAFRGEL